jgi:hypothetical protein
MICPWLLMPVAMLSLPPRVPRLQQATGRPRGKLLAALQEASEGLAHVGDWARSNRSAFAVTTSVAPVSAAIASQRLV